jgi:hypothetical protein
MHDAHSPELARATQLRGEKKNARRVVWVEHRSTTTKGTRELCRTMLYPRDAPRILLLARENSKLRLRVLRDGHRPSSQ